MSDSRSYVIRPPYVMRAVVRVNQSPLNERQWCLELECGHEKWETAKRKPQILKISCWECGKLSKGDAK